MVATRALAREAVRPTFRSTVAFDRPDGHRLAVVPLDRDCESFAHLVGHEVAIDRALYLCEDVHAYGASPPFKKGQSVGLIVREH